MSRIVKYLPLPRGRKIYSFRADWVTLETLDVNARRKYRSENPGRPALSSRRSILPYHCGFICFLLFSRSRSNLIRSFGTVDAITTSPGVQHAPVSARNIHS